MGTERSTGKFRCPSCFQTYSVPPATVEMIVAHLMRHGIEQDKRWVKRRLEEVRAEDS